MKLIYTDTGKEVRVGDRVELISGLVTVTHFRPPHKSSSSGKVTVRFPDGSCVEYYVSVIGAKWVDREDQK